LLYFPFNMKEGWKVGIATVLITPTEPMWLAGFARRTRPAEGTASELYAKAIALEDVAGHRLVILTADLIAMPREIADWISAQCARRLGLRREQLLLSTSHTHSGPEVRPSKVLFFNIPDEFAKKIPAFVEQLQEKMVAAIAAALDALAPARLFAGQGTAGFANNRRGAEKYFDHDVPVLHVTDLNGKPRALLFGYACHNTTLWEDSYVFCGDYAGFAQQYLQEKFPDVTAMFLCGAAADQNPDPRAKLSYAQQHGRELAEGVAKAMSQKMEIEPILAVQFEKVPIDFRPIPSQEQLIEQTKSEDKPVARKAQFLLDHRNEFDSSYPFPLQVIQLGKQLLLIAICGEPVVEYAMKLKVEYAGQKLVWVAGYTNDMFGYVPTLRVQREGGYEGGRAALWSALPMPWTEDVEPRVMGAIRRMVEKI
jgi:neutral ceramidase